MAGYYDALIAAWNNPTQPPPGVTGDPLTGSMTTDQKLTTVNAWTITGTIPASLYSNNADLVNCINWAEFKALTAAQQTNLLNLLACPGPLLGGSANASLITQGMMSEYFANHSGPTFTALKNLAKGAVRAWWGVPVAENGAGLSSPVSQTDLQLAGLS